MTNKRPVNLPGSAYRVNMEYEISAMIRQMTIEGVPKEECISEMQLLADFVRVKADGLQEAWRPSSRYHI